MIDVKLGYWSLSPLSVILGIFNKEKVLDWAFPGHCETSRRLVDSSIGDEMVTQCQRGAHRCQASICRIRVRSSGVIKPCKG